MREPIIVVKEKVSSVFLCAQHYCMRTTVFILFCVTLTLFFSYRSKSHTTQQSIRRSERGKLWARSWNRVGDFLGSRSTAAELDCLAVVRSWSWGSRWIVNVLYANFCAVHKCSMWREFALMILWWWRWIRLQVEISTFRRFTQDKFCNRWPNLSTILIWSTFPS